MPASLLQKPQHRISVAYLLSALSWIFLSDGLLALFNIDAALVSIASVIKGMLFVFVTAALLYFYLSREFAHRLRLEAALRQQIDQVSQSQAAVAQGEARFRKAIEEAPYPIMLLAEDGEVLILSRAWTDITGYAREQLSTVAAWTELAYGPDKQPILEGIHRLFELKTRRDEGEFTITCADGSRRIWLFSSTALDRLPDNRRIVMSIATDVTERKVAQARLQQLVNRLQLAVDTLRLGIWQLDVQTGRMTWNQHQHEIYGLSPEAFAQDTDAWRLLVHPEDRDYANERFETIFSAGYVYDVHYRIIRPDGDVRYIAASGAAEKDSRGEIVSLVGINLDVTAYELARQKLAASEARYRTLFNGTLHPIVVCDPEAQIKMINAAAAADFGLLPDAVLDKPLQDVIPQLYRLTRESLQQALVTGIPAFVEDMITWQGAERWYQVSIQPMDDGEQATIIQLVLNDTTERRQAESIALENERLRARFQKESERSALVHRIISALSHDLRTPLTVISSSKDMLLQYADRLSEEKRREKLDAIGRQVQFALELLDDTVNMVRGNLADMVFRPTLVNVAALCQVIVEETGAVGGTEQRIRFINRRSLQMAVVDEALVSRILLNLLSNALKYSSPDSEVRLELDSENASLILRVIDQGVGISASDLPYIFDPFYRAHNVGSVRGTGLGLSIVRDCVRRHQGTIEVTSVLGQGSTFIVKLPSARVESAGLRELGYTM